MWRWLVLVMCLGLFVAPQFAHTASETCTNDVQCSLSIAVSDTNSEINFGFKAEMFCVWNESTSTNAIYVKYYNADATAVDDGNDRIDVGDDICISEFRTQVINIISASAGDTAKVLALRDLNSPLLLP